jgi:hypothetical protein
VPEVVGVTACVPVADRAPDQPPLAVHEVPSFDAQVSVLVWPSVSEAGEADSVTVDGGRAGVPLLPPPPPPQAVKAAVAVTSNVCSRVRNAVRFHAGRQVFMARLLCAMRALGRWMGCCEYGVPAKRF